MPTALIADDEPHLARALAAQLRQAWPELEPVHLARNGLEAAQMLADLSPDVAFLDIQMPGLTGLEVAHEFTGATQIVFVTAYDEYAVQAFEQEAFDYILKPVKAERLARVVQRLQEVLARRSQASASGHNDEQRLLAVLQRLAPNSATPPSEPLRWVRASSGDLTHQVDVQDVLFFRADDKYTCVQTATHEHLIRTTIAELAEALDARQFQQVHRSTIVNLAHLAGTRRDEASRLFLRIKGYSGELPVSRAYVHLFKAM
jgi:DNA-binding LytR/AlgR family response regulator